MTAVLSPYWQLANVPRFSRDGRPYYVWIRFPGNESNVHQIGFYCIRDPQALHFLHICEMDLLLPIRLDLLPQEYRRCDCIVVEKEEDSHERSD